MEPLANRIRPKSLKDYVGQDHIVGSNGPSNKLGAGPLRRAIEDKHLFSFILWGPPGTGKTTLAKIYAQALDARLYELSAVSAGKDDIRKIVEEPDNLLEGRRMISLALSSQNRSFCSWTRSIALIKLSKISFCLMWRAASSL
ncbi:MAG: AAA family ATPase [Candidatus Taylorbacteria bacterium]|nr:AAA family ATPase [Candidatus Taylorbacteria bacterium]